MALSHEQVVPKMSAKVQIYTLNGAVLLCSLYCEIPCMFVSPYFFFLILTSNFDRAIWFEISFSQMIFMGLQF